MNKRSYEIEIFVHEKTCRVLQTVSVRVRVKLALRLGLGSGGNIWGNFFLEPWKMH